MKKHLPAYILCLLFLTLPCIMLNAESNLKVAVLGDSMTWIGGEAFEKPIGWTHYTSELPVMIKSFARSGATWTNTTATKGEIKVYSETIDPENVIYNQVLRLFGSDFNPDIVIIFAGTNDAWFEAQRPGMFNESERPDHALGLADNPSDFTTLEGSIRLAGALLNQHLSSARVCLVTPPHSGKIPEENITRVSDIIETTGRELGYTILRGDREFGFHHNEESAKPYRNTYDGVHSNEDGARRIADCIKRNILEPELVILRNK